MPYKIAGIDVHKRMLHVVVSDVEVDGEYEFTRRVFGSYPEALRSLAAWLVQEQVEEVKRLVANELTLSFVPDVGQRLWRATPLGSQVLNQLFFQHSSRWNE
jgi:hypothetical protein